jgi:flagellar hook-associated protein 3 FlgL
MTFRVTDGSSNARLIAQITAGRQRIAAAQERISTGKRVNRPSDDPVAAGAVVRLRTSEAALAQFERNVGVAEETLLAGDNALNAYESILDRARALLTQGGSDNTDAAGKKAIAAEIEHLRTQTLTIANQKIGDRYLFGGTRQDAPPYNSTGIPAATPTAQQLLQLDPDGLPAATGVTAETVFADATGTVFTELENAATALRGTGDPVADRTAILTSLDRLTVLAEQARSSRALIGNGLERVEYVSEQLTQRSLVLAQTAERVEEADFVEAALDLTSSQQALEAILQTRAVTNGRTLLDLLG